MDPDDPSCQQLSPPAQGQTAQRYESSGQAAWRFVAYAPAPARLDVETQTLLHRVARLFDGDGNFILGGAGGAQAVAQARADLLFDGASEAEGSAQVRAALTAFGEGDRAAGFAEAGSTWDTEVSAPTYRAASLRAQANYWADHIGLDPNAAPDRAGSLQAQTNFLLAGYDQYGADIGQLRGDVAGLNLRVDGLQSFVARSTAMSAALQEPTIPQGQRGGLLLSAANFSGQTGLSFSLGSALGARSKLSFAGALAPDSSADRLFRLNYSLSW